MTTQPKPDAALEPPEGPGRRPRRSRLALVLALAIPGALIALVALALFVVRLYAGSQGFEERIAGLLKDSAHVDLDYGSLSLAPTSGIEIDAIRVASPEAWRKFAPDLLRIDRAEVEWDVLSLASGPMRAPRVLVSGVHAAVVIDASGATSLDGLGGPPSAPSAPASEATPLSRTLELGGLDLQVDSIAASGVTLRLIETRDGAVVRESSFDGLDLEGALSLTQAAVKAKARLHSTAAEGTRVVVKPSRPEAGPEGEARVVIDLTADVPDAHSVGVRLLADLAGQNLSKDAPDRGRIADMKVDARLSPDRQQTEVRVVAALLDGALTADSTVTVPDAKGSGAALLPDIGEAGFSLTLDKVPAALLALVPGLRCTGCTASGRATGIALGVGDAGFAVRGGIEASVSAPDGSFEAPGISAQTKGLSVKVSASPAAGGTFDMKTTVAAGTLDGTAGGATVHASDVSIEGGLDRVPLALPGVKMPGGDVRLALRTGTLDATTPDATVRTTGLGLSVDGPVPGEGAPVTVRARVPFERIAFSPSRGPGIELPAGSVEADLRDVRIDPKAPASAEGIVSLRADLGPLDATVDAQRQGDEASFDVTLDARGLGIASPFLPAAARRLGIPWARVGVTAKAKGTVRHPTDLDRLYADAKIDVSAKRLALKASERQVGLPNVQVKATVKGTRAAPEFVATLDAAAPTVDGKALVESIAARLKLVRANGRVGIEASTRSIGRKGPVLDATVNAGFARASRTVDWDARVTVGDLSEPVAAFLPKKWRKMVSWDKIALGMTSHGSFAGVVTGLRGGLVPVMAARPLLTARGDQKTTIDLSGVRYKSGGMTISVPSVSAAVTAEAADGTATARARVSHPRIDVVLGPNRVEVGDGTHEATLRSSGSPTEGETGLDVSLKIADVVQDFAPFYAVGGLSLTGAARIDRMKSLRLDRMTLENVAGGTKIDLSVAVDEPGGTGTTARPDSGAGPTPIQRVPGRKSLAVEGAIEQSLDRLKLDASVFQGKGKVRLPFRVESGDQSLYRATATLEAHGVDVALPSRKVDVRGMNGSVRIVEELGVGSDGVPKLIVGAGDTTYARVRFQDLHPFLAGGSFLSIEKLVAGPVDIGPIAGNLRVFHDVLSLDQIEAAWRGGSVTGQLVVDNLAAIPNVFFRGDITGVKPSTNSNDRLDANAALRLSLSTMELDGRVQIPQIGRGHLLDLLDALDPYREEVSMNRIRKVLALGYPKFVRILIEQGFLSAKVELGGVASVVRIDEVRGIATGPLLRKVLGPLVQKGDGR